MLSRADVVTLHMVLSARTRGIIGVNELGMMKPGALLVNTSRGALVDEDALIRALQEKHIAAGLDVYDEEPLPATHPLRFCDNAVLTPHIGYVTQEVYEVFYKDTAEDVLAYLNGAPVRMLNPEVLERPSSVVQRP